MVAMINLVELYDATVDQLVNEGMDRANAARVAVLHIYTKHRPEPVNGLLRDAEYSGQIETQTGANPMPTATHEIHANNTALATRAAKEWSTIAKEPVQVEQISDNLYAFGSELAALRLEHAFKECTHARAAFSPPAQSWYFTKKVFV